MRMSSFLTSRLSSAGELDLTSKPLVSSPSGDTDLTTEISCFSSTDIFRGYERAGTAMRPPRLLYIPYIVLRTSDQLTPASLSRGEAIMERR